MDWSEPRIMVERHQRGARAHDLGVASGSLGRDYASARPVPNGRRTRGIATADRHPQGLRCPRVAMGPQRTAALFPREHSVDVLSLDAVNVPDFDRGQETVLDPVADRLRGQLELLSDLIDREVLLAEGWL